MEGICQEWRLETLIQTIWIYSKNKGMEFVIEKASRLLWKKDKQLNEMNYPIRKASEHLKIIRKLQIPAKIRRVYNERNSRKEYK